MSKPKIYRIRSQTHKDIIYTVQFYNNGVAICDCIYYQFKGYKIGQGTCKHINYLLKKHYSL